MIWVAQTRPKLQVKIMSVLIFFSIIVFLDCSWNKCFFKFTYDPL